MKSDHVNALASAAVSIAARGAAEYLHQHKLTADPNFLAECLRAMVKARLQEALADAKAALDCNMGQIAAATFSATMTQAGIDAAKEASQAPRGWDSVTA
jgi:hypothetical protein